MTFQLLHLLENSKHAAGIIVVGLLVTARIRKMREGNIFSLFTPAGGTPIRLTGG